ncbi:hypothetical protein GCM10023201_41290 [Actinomycetospora corticicola]|uniref:Uncharacterized protein n=1 Tax=Actinomycetospora corticicola TaxID=663602 RepID=A0A7Y9DWI6_9PSEU|nr:hypothetical protein [Actinomycetospora corticicola]NYD36784.1 hypothetical protein [Actinomycetospora corticicola]
MTPARPVRAAPGSAAFLAIVDRAVPARSGHDHSRPMCAAWDDHLSRELAALTAPPTTEENR